MIYKGNAKIRESGSYGIYHGSNPIGAVYHGSDKVYIFKKKTTWQAGTTLQAYQVSKYCNKIRVDCVASRGFLVNKLNTGDISGKIGKGGRVQCEMTVTPNQILYISVGEIPTSNTSGSYNAADIRTNNSGLTNTTSLQSRLIVAGGGGGTGWKTDSSGYAQGGDGGGTTGGRGRTGFSMGGGYGGTQSDGGSGGGSGDFGSSGVKGSFGLGGNKGDARAGHGGSGWYGGGSGGTGTYYVNWGGAGGGGSSYTNSTLCDNVTHTQGYQNGAGYITITEIE